LSKLLPKRDALQRIEALYVDFRERKGRRPSAGEMYAMDRDAIRVAATHHRSWFAFVSSKSDLSDGERRVTQSHGDFFDEVANSKMERSYKMLVLQAMMELSRMPGDVSINDLADRFTLIASRSPALRSELEVTLAGGVQLPSMLKSEPLRAWAGTKRRRDLAPGKWTPTQGAVRLCKARIPWARPAESTRVSSRSKQSARSSRRGGRSPRSPTVWASTATC
jgi:hypothetical protein